MVRPNPHLEGFRRDSDRLGDRSALVCLDRNERVSPFPPEVFAAMVGQLRPEHFTAYPDLDPIYDRLSRATGVAIDGICVGAGSDALIRRAFQAFLKPGDTVVAPDPSYGMYPVYSRMFEAAFRPVPYGDDLTLDLGAFTAAIAGARLVCLANPDQPTGAVLGLDALRRVARAARDADALLLVDEAYYPFASETAIPLLAEFDNLMVVRTFSKVGGLAGLRVGYALTSPDIARPLHVVRGSGEVNAAGAVMATWLLDHPEVMEDFRRSAEDGRAVLLAAAERLGLGAPASSGNFQLLRLPRGVDPAVVARECERRGTLIKAGFQHPALADCIRVTIDSPEIIGAFLPVLEQALAAARPARSL